MSSDRHDESGERTKRTTKPPERYGVDIQEQEILRKKASRKGKLSALSRCINKARRLIQNKGSRTEVKALQNMISQRLFPDIEEINHALIKLFVSTDEIEAAEVWISQVCESREVCLGEINAYLEELMNLNQNSLYAATEKIGRV